MLKNSEFQELNADDKRLIALKVNKTINYVDKVLRGDRNNKIIISLAFDMIAKKEELKKDFLNESLTDVIETVTQ